LGNLKSYYLESDVPETGQFEQLLLIDTDDVAQTKKLADSIIYA